MGIFGKGHSHRKSARVIPARKRIVRERGRRKLIPSGDYGIHKSSLLAVSIALKCDVRQEVRHELRAHPNGVVVDWGCGTGTAITELAESLKKGNYYGFSHVAYSDWRENEQVKFVHAPAEDFARYFRKIPIRYMYSHWGLSHVPVHTLMPYLPKLLSCFEVGGKLVFNHLRLSKSVLEQAGLGMFSVQEQGLGVFRLTRLR